MERCFGTSDAYSQDLRSSATRLNDVVVNCDPLQLALGDRARRRPLAAPSADGVAPRRADHRVARGVLDKIVAAQIAEYDPRSCTSRTSGSSARPSLIDCAARRLVVGQIASPPPESERLRRFDLFITSFPHFVERFRALGVESEYLQIGFHAQVLERLRPDARGATMYAFVGGLDPRVPRARHCPARAAVLQAFDVESGATALGRSQTSPILRRYHGEAWGLDMYRVLARLADRGQSPHRAAEGYANNMRLLRGDRRRRAAHDRGEPRTSTLFEPGDEVVAYEDVDDLIGEDRCITSSTTTSGAIAAAGQARTLSDHTYERIMAELRRDARATSRAQ